MVRRNKKAIDAELEQLYAKRQLTKPNVVRVAKDPKNPLHKVIYYCSDDKAAYEHRLEKAGEIIREFEERIVIKKMEIRIPKWVHVKNSPGFIHIGDVKNNKATAREFMRNELTMARALVDRCYKFSLLLGFNGRLNTIVTSIDHILENI